MYAAKKNSATSTLQRLLAAVNDRPSTSVSISDGTTKFSIQRGTSNEVGPTVGSAAQEVTA
ncbi:hypothetical protein SRABI26_00465 [Arthrobacter sp. Bi26]|nr:hypothetical protein SRABI26_00465 [Arthrobacter sp. Bi26]